jgi:hypothetical protein
MLAAARSTTIAFTLLMITIPTYAEDCASKLDASKDGWKELVNCLKRLEDNTSIPSGAIVAFVGECPSKEFGWEAYADGTGKFILGAGDKKGLLEYRGPHIPAGKNAGDRIELSLVIPGDQGGEEAHVLTEPELPSHSHDMKLYRRWGDKAFPTGNGWGGDGGAADEVTNQTMTK